MVKAPIRTYRSTRTGKNPATAVLTYEALRSLVRSAYEHFNQEGYFAEYFGYWCVDNDDVPGKAGSDVRNYVFLHLRRDGLWPLSEKILSYTEDDLFDVIEFLYDHVSKPIAGNFHSFANCGMHWHTFDRKSGQREFQAAINPLIESYSVGYRLSDNGEIIECGPIGLSNLLDAQVLSAELTVTERIQGAVDRFRRHGAKLDDRQKAVRDLADVLEWLRPQIRTTLLKKDESDLFKIANEFGIRHLNQNQKLAYDHAVWLSWMFYYYLATIHACLHLVERQKRNASPTA